MSCIENARNDCRVSSNVTETTERHVCHCDRKIFCCVCNEHIFWKEFGVHIIQHCSTEDSDNALECPVCGEYYNNGKHILIHFVCHVRVEPHDPDCLDCCCSRICCCTHPLCRKTWNSDTNSSRFESQYCYICHEYVRCIVGIVFHMTFHSTEEPLRTHLKTLDFSALCNCVKDKSSIKV